MQILKQSAGVTERLPFAVTSPESSRLSNKPSANRSSEGEGGQTLVLQFMQRVSPSSIEAFAFAVVGFVVDPPVALAPSETKVEFFLETGAESGLILPSEARLDELSDFGPRNEFECSTGVREMG